MALNKHLCCSFSRHSLVCDDRLDPCEYSGRISHHFNFMQSPFKTRFRPFITASNLATLTWVVSFFFLNQVASSTVTHYFLHDSWRYAAFITPHNSIDMFACGEQWYCCLWLHFALG